MGLKYSLLGILLHWRAVHGEREAVSKVSEVEEKRKTFAFTHRVVQMTISYLVGGRSPGFARAVNTRHCENDEICMDEMEKLVTKESECVVCNRRRRRCG